VSQGESGPAGFLRNEILYCRLCRSVIRGKFYQIFHFHGLLILTKRREAEISPFQTEISSKVSYSI